MGTPVKKNPEPAVVNLLGDQNRQDAESARRLPGEAMKGARPPIHVVPKGWGREVWIANNDLYCGKILEIKKGKRCSLHFHQIKNETFYLRSGRLLVRSKKIHAPRLSRSLKWGPASALTCRPAWFIKCWRLRMPELYEFSTQHFESDSHV